MTRPESFIEHTRFSTLGSYSQGNSMAYVLPTTREVAAVARKLLSEGRASVVCGRLSEFSGSTTIPALLDGLRAGVRPTLVLLADQFVASDEATVLVKSSLGDFFLSPIEHILSQRYSYDLAHWTSAGFEITTAPCEDARRLYSQSMAYLRSCASLDGDWQLRGQHVRRSLNFRIQGAKRKIRLFRSSAIDAYRDNPDHPTLQEHLLLAERGEHRIQEALESTC